MKTKPKTKTSKKQSTVKKASIEPPRPLESLTIKELRKLIQIEVKKLKVLSIEALNGIDSLASKFEDKNRLCDVVRMLSAVNCTCSKALEALKKGELKL